VTIEAQYDLAKRRLSEALSAFRTGKGSLRDLERAMGKVARITWTLDRRRGSAAALNPGDYDLSK
jgi:hypothetical protein